MFPVLQWVRGDIRTELSGGPVEYEDEANAPKPLEDLKVFENIRTQGAITWDIYMVVDEFVRIERAFERPKKWKLQNQRMNADK